MNDTPVAEMNRRDLCGILVATTLGCAIKIISLAYYAASANLLLPVIGVRSEINEPGHNARHAYFQMSFAVKTKTSPKWGKGTKIKNAKQFLI